MRKYFPYISIGVGILVIALYMWSTANYNKAKADHETQLISEANKNKSKDNAEVDRYWISGDGEYIYKMQKDASEGISLYDINKDNTTKFQRTESASGAKYKDDSYNIFWNKGEEATLEYNSVVTSLYHAKKFKGMYSYLADSNILKLCNSDDRYPILMAGCYLDIEVGYQLFGKPGEYIYIELYGVEQEAPAMDGDQMIQVILPAKLIKLQMENDCG